MTREPKPDLQSTSQEWIPDPEVINKQDDLYTRTWESDYRTLIFDNDQQKSSPCNPHEASVEMTTPMPKRVAHQQHEKLPQISSPKQTD